MKLSGAEVPTGAALKKLAAASYPGYFSAFNSVGPDGVEYRFRTSARLRSVELDTGERFLLSTLQTNFIRPNICNHGPMTRRNKTRLSWLDEEPTRPPEWKLAAAVLLAAVADLRRPGRLKEYQPGEPIPADEFLLNPELSSFWFSVAGIDYHDVRPALAAMVHRFTM
jgi:hypothetical protein